ncbi:hypothetical protein TNCV_2565771 [Trichonephila clavipes]|nr:hypothetical protein TNCV_2565771 [Trichonephila clavipes]
MGNNNLLSAPVLRGSVSASSYLLIAFQSLEFVAIHSKASFQQLSTFAVFHFGFKTNTWIEKQDFRGLYRMPEQLSEISFLTALFSGDSRVCHARGVLVEILIRSDGSVSPKRATQFATPFSKSL